MSIFLLLSVSILLADDVSVSAAVDRSAIKLSEPVTITLKVIGPSPLVVVTPQNWLNEDSAGRWLAKVKTEPRIQIVRDGIEEWRCEIECDPFAVGAPNVIQLNPVSIRYGNRIESISRDWPLLNLTVTSEISSQNLKTASRPITGIEELPSIPKQKSYFWEITLGFLTLGFIVFLLRNWLLKKFGKQEKQLTVHEQWKNAIENYQDSKPEMLDSISTILHSMPMQDDKVTQLLTECNRLRFSGVEIKPTEYEALIRSMGELLQI